MYGSFVRNIKANFFGQFFYLLEIELYRGIVGRIVLPVPKQRTKINPDAAGSEYFMEDAEVVDDVFSGIYEEAGKDCVPLSGLIIALIVSGTINLFEIPSYEGEI